MNIREAAEAFVAKHKALLTKLAQRDDEDVPPTLRSAESRLQLNPKVATSEELFHPPPSPEWEYPDE